MQDDGLGRLVQGEAFNSLDRFTRACRNVGGSLLGMIARQFPVFLVLEAGTKIERFLATYQVRIYRTERSFELLLNENKGSFTFELPNVLFSLYADGGALTFRRALNLKEHALSNIQVCIRVGDEIRVLRFILDLHFPRKPIGEQAPADEISPPHLRGRKLPQPGPSGRRRGNYSSELSGRSELPFDRRQTVQRAGGLPRRSSPGPPGPLTCRCRKIGITAPCPVAAGSVFSGKVQLDGEWLNTIRVAFAG